MAETYIQKLCAVLVKTFDLCSSAVIFARNFARDCHFSPSLSVTRSFAEQRYGNAKFLS